MFAESNKIPMEDEKTIEKVDTFSHKLKQLMTDQGRKNSWLAEKMGIEHQTLLKKFRKDSFNVTEEAFIKNLLEMY